MPNSQPVAVIDIGSNSVRLVVYDGLKRSPMPLFNEKVLCGLAKDIDATGILNSEGVKRAVDAVQRFVALSKIMQVTKLDIFATAAVRDAKDGHAFVKNINDKFGVKVTIFSGEQEAKYAGLGIISSITRASGVVGDLGGGSLELININKDKTGDGKSFPIGPLRFGDSNIHHKDVVSTINGFIKKFPLKKFLQDEDFYAVGGSFRNLAKVHMGRKNYPLKVIHNYRVDAEDLMTTIQIVARMSEESLLRIPGVSKKRVNFLPYAAMVLKSIIEIGNPKRIVFTASGVREGVLYDQLEEPVKTADPLISGCTEIMSRMLRDSEYGYELAKWMEPLFSHDDSVREKRLRLAACIMSEISCYENTEYRGEMAYRKILDSSLTGLTHKDRVFIAKSLYCRYSSNPDDNILSTMGPLLSSKKVEHAQIIGSAMRLARSLSCSHVGVLTQTKLKLTKDKLTLHISNNNTSLDGESIRKRVMQLAEVMGREGEVK